MEVLGESSCRYGHTLPSQQTSKAISFALRVSCSQALSVALSLQHLHEDVAYSSNCDSDKQLSDIISLGPIPHLPSLPHAHLPEHTEWMIRFCTNTVRRYVSGYWHLRLANPHRSAHQIPDVSASGYMGLQGNERAFADVLRGEMEVCAGLDTGMPCIAT